MLALLSHRRAGFERMSSIDFNTHLLSYGTLLFPEVMLALIGRVPEFQDIRIPGYARFALNGRSYPGIRRLRKDESDEEFEFRLYFDLDPTAHRVIERFEDELYERAKVPVLSKRGELSAHLYLIPERLWGELSSEAWDPAVFRKEYLPRYVEECRMFRTSVLA